MNPPLIRYDMIIFNELIQTDMQPAPFHSP